MCWLHCATNACNPFLAFYNILKVNYLTKLKNVAQIPIIAYIVNISRVHITGLFCVMWQLLIIVETILYLKYPIANWNIGSIPFHIFQFKRYLVTVTFRLISSVIHMTTFGETVIQLTHWSRVTHICVSKLTIIGSDNGLSPGRRQAIIWSNARIMLIRPLGTNFSEILIGVRTFSFRKMDLKMSFANWCPFVSASMSQGLLSRCLCVSLFVNNIYWNQTWTPCTT